MSREIRKKNELRALTMEKNSSDRSIRTFSDSFFQGNNRNFNMKLLLGVQVQKSRHQEEQEFKQATASLEIHNKTSRSPLKSFQRGSYLISHNKLIYHKEI